VQQGRNLGGKKNTAPESARILISISTVVKIGVGDNVKKIALSAELEKTQNQ
jgi:hypothetical protein